jgi:adenine specific DNA methylase Mod
MSIRNRVIRTVAAAVMAHMAMDEIVHEPWSILNVTWWVRSCLLAAVMVLTTELFYIQEYFKNGKKP